jgi:tripartite-type tricarboxylate transporter receptor subunit TctC
MLTHLRVLGSIAGVVLGAAFLAAPALAQYPDKPITIVVTAAVGGSIDALSRQLGQSWEPAIGKGFVIDNKEGGGGVTGVRYFMSRPDDGYTIMVCTEAHLTTALQKTDTFTLDDLEVINVQQFDPTSITVRADSRFKTIDDLIKEAKEKPNTLTWGSPTSGSAALVGKLWAKSFGLQVRFVPQDSGASSDTALMGGHVDIKLGTAAGDFAELGDKVRVLAIAAPKRVHFLPNVPTVDELAKKYGVEPIANLGTARIVAVRASLKTKHPDRYKQIVDSYKAAFHNPAYQEVLKKTGQAPATQFMTPTEANVLIRQLYEGSIKSRKEFGG